jgi:hypothetical protein
MRRWTALLLAALAPVAHAQIDPSQSGLWFNPAQNGHGVEVTMLSPTSGTLTWFVYDGQGRPLHLGGVGTVTGNRLTVPVTYNRGMRFGTFVPADNRSDAWGEVSVTFSGCNTAQLEWTSTYTLDGFSFGNGSMPLTRLTTVGGLPCGKRRASGLYAGLVRVTNATTSTDVTALLDESGRAFLVGNQQRVIFAGNYTTSGNNITITGSSISAVGYSFTNGSTTQTWNGTGTFVEADFINGTYTGATDTGIFSLQASPAYRRGASLATLAGRYTGSTRGTATITLDISAAGAITGTDSNSCQYAGTATVPNPVWNSYAVQIAITGCTQATGTFTGSASRSDSDGFGDGKLLVIGAVNETRSLPLLVEKQ